MKRISKQAKAIADAHIEAKIAKSFSNPSFAYPEEMRNAIKNGATSEALMEEVEIRYCPITSIILANMGHISKAYRSGVYQGFRILLD